MTRRIWVGEEVGIETMYLSAGDTLAEVPSSGLWRVTALPHMFGGPSIRMEKVSDA